MPNPLHNNPPTPTGKSTAHHVTTPASKDGSKVNGAFLGVLSGSKHTVVENSVYNWVELVYRAFGYEIPDTSKHCALLGIREVALTTATANASTMTSLERSAGVSPGESDQVNAPQSLFSQIRETDRFNLDKQGKPVATKAQSRITFNDLLYLAWTNEGKTKDQNTTVVSCTIDPGFNESDTTGTPLLLEGYLYRIKPTDHHGESGAFQVYSGVAPNIRLAREATKSKSVFTKITDALLKGHARNGNKDWLFCTDEANDTIHIHWSLDYGSDAKVKNWSSGCTVISHSAASDRYSKDFRKRIESAPNKAEVPYLIVSSKYIRLYDDWYQNVQREPGTRTTTSSVVKVDALPTLPNSNVRLPSIVTLQFVTEVQSAIEQLKAGTYSDSIKTSMQTELATRLEKSLANICIASLKV